MNLKKSRELFLRKMFVLNINHMIERMEDYYTTVQIANDEVDLPPFIKARDVVYSAIKNGRIDRYGNIKVA